MGGKTMNYLVYSPDRKKTSLCESRIDVYKIAREWIHITGAYEYIYVHDLETQDTYILGQMLTDGEPGFALTMELV